MQLMTISLLSLFLLIACDSQPADQGPRTESDQATGEGADASTASEVDQLVAEQVDFFKSMLALRAEPDAAEKLKPGTSTMIELERRKDLLAAKLQELTPEDRAQVESRSKELIKPMADLIATEIMQRRAQKMNFPAKVQEVLQEMATEAEKKAAK